MQLDTRHLDRRGDGGLSVTELGFGGAPLGNLYRPLDEAEAEALLERAWAAGLRYYDTAPLYGLGLSETRLGRFLRARSRDDVVLSTKVGRRLVPCAPARRTGRDFWIDAPARRAVFDYSHDGVMRALEASLARLGVDRIDIVFVHDIDARAHGGPAQMQARIDELMARGYRALERLRAEGTIRAFGVGVNEWEVCEDLALRGDFDVFLLAGRYTLLEQGALTRLLPLCTARGIGVIVGGPYNSGILATGARAGAQAGEGTRAGARYDYRQAPARVIDRVARIETVCARHGVRLGDAALQFPLRHPAVVSVIPGTRSVAELDAAVAGLRAEIPDALWAELKAEGLLHADAPVAPPRRGLG